MSHRYDIPGASTRAFNAAIRRLAELGISIRGSAALRVRGRRSGQVRAVVVNPLTVEGRRFLVSPRGNTQWARNVRAAGEVDLGPTRSSRRYRVAEIDDDAKPELLQRYLRRWYWEVKGHVGGLTPTSAPAELRAVAPSIPVFELLG